MSNFPLVQYVAEHKGSEYFSVPEIYTDEDSQNTCIGCVFHGDESRDCIPVRRACIDSRRVLIERTKKAYTAYIQHRTRCKLGVKTDDD